MSSDDEKDKYDDLKVYGIFRDYIKHEDSLINNRMTWMLTIHGFLYATFGFTLQKILEILEKEASQIASHICETDFINSYVNNSALNSVVGEARFFLYCICIVGLVISSSALWSITSAYDAVFEIKTIFESYAKSYRVPLNLRVDHWRFEEWSRVYNLRYKNIWVKTPLLTGGGRPGGAKSGFGAAWSIPFILVFSWFFSVAFVYISSINNTKENIGGDKCTISKRP